MSGMSESSRARRGGAVGEPRWVRVTLIALAVGLLVLVVLLPVVLVFAQALSKGMGGWLRAITAGEARSAIGLTLLTASIAVPLNTAFGVAAAWLIARYQFTGRQLLVTLIDLPFAISPVVSRPAVSCCCSGHRARSGPGSPRTRSCASCSRCRASCWPPLFVTFPFVARELIPLHAGGGRATRRSQRADARRERAGRCFCRVTLPNAQAGRCSTACMLCNARAMGEFGAVSVVSGHIRGETQHTLPLQVEILYNEYQFSAAPSRSPRCSRSSRWCTLAARKRFVEGRTGDETIKRRR